VRDFRTRAKRRGGSFAFLPQKGGGFSRPTQKVMLGSEVIGPDFTENRRRLSGMSYAF
jgi:hypothetical protein